MFHRSLGTAAALVMIVIGNSATHRPSATFQPPANRAVSPVLTAMQQELARSMETLKTRPLPAYFLSYEITERHSVSVQGAFGTLNSSEDTRNRSLAVDLRVGSNKFDNTHPIRGGMPIVPIFRMSRRGHRCRLTTIRPRSAARALASDRRQVQTRRRGKYHARQGEHAGARCR